MTQLISYNLQMNLIFFSKNYDFSLFFSLNSFESVSGQVPLLQGVAVEIGHVEGRLVDVAQDRIQKVLVADIL